MAWTASVKSVNKQPSLILVEVEYADGTTTLTETYKLYGPPDADWLKRTATQKIAILEGLAATSVSAGTIAKWTDPADPEEAKLRTALRKLETIKLLVDTKVLLATDQRVVDFVDGLKAKVDTYWDKL